VGCYIWYSEEGIERGLRPLFAVPNVTAKPSTAVCVCESIPVPIPVQKLNSPQGGQILYADAAAGASLDHWAVFSSPAIITVTVDEQFRI